MRLHLRRDDLLDAAGARSRLNPPDGGEGRGGPAAVGPSSITRIRRQAVALSQLLLLWSTVRASSVCASAPSQCVRKKWWEVYFIWQKEP